MNVAWVFAPLFLRLLLTTIAITLLWTTTLTNCMQLASQWLPSPKIGNTRDQWIALANLTLQERDHYRDCSQRQFDYHDQLQNASATAEQERSNQVLSDNAAALGAWTPTVDECSTVAQSQLQALQAWQTWLQNSGAWPGNWSFARIPDTAECSDMEAWLINLDLLAAGSNQLELTAQQYLASMNQLQATAEERIEARRAYDEAYIDQHLNWVPELGFNFSVDVLADVECAQLITDPSLCSTPDWNFDATWDAALAPLTDLLEDIGAELDKWTAALAVFDEVAAVLEPWLEALGEAVDAYNDAFGKAAKAVADAINAIFSFISGQDKLINNLGPIDLTLPTWDDINLANILGFPAALRELGDWQVPNLPLSTLVDFGPLRQAIASKLLGWQAWSTTLLDDYDPPQFDTAAWQATWQQEEANYTSYSAQLRQQILEQQAAAAGSVDAVEQRWTQLTANASRLAAQLNATLAVAASNASLPVDLSLSEAPVTQEEFASLPDPYAFLTAINSVWLFIVTLDIIYRVVTTIHTVSRTFLGTETDVLVVDAAGTKQKRWYLKPMWIKAFGAMIVVAVLVVLAVVTVVSVMLSVYLVIYRDFQQGCLRSEEGTIMGQNLGALLFNSLSVEFQVELTAKQGELDLDWLDSCSQGVGEALLVWGDQLATWQAWTDVQLEAQNTLQNLDCLDMNTTLVNATTAAFAAAGVLNPWSATGRLQRDACGTNALQLNESWFDCDRLYRGRLSCLGPDRDALEAISIRASCVAEHIFHAYAMRFILALLLIVGLNGGRLLLVRGLQTLWSRSLTPKIDNKHWIWMAEYKAATKAATNARTDVPQTQIDVPSLERSMVRRNWIMGTVWLVMVVVLQLPVLILAQILS